MSDPRMTANQLVAYNLFRARILRGLTQDQAAAALEPFLGERWSTATFSAAERSVAGKRVRQFSADEIMAFAQAFGVSTSWFFVTPWPDDPFTRLPKIKAPKSVPEERLLDPGSALERVVDLAGIEHLVDAVLPTLELDEQHRVAEKLEQTYRSLREWVGRRAVEQQRRGDQEVAEFLEHELEEGDADA